MISYLNHLIFIVDNPEWKFIWPEKKVLLIKGPPFSYCSEMTN